MYKRIKDYKNYLRKLEAYASKHPKLYNFNVYMLAAFGVTFVLGFFILFLGLIGALIFLSTKSHHLNVGVIKLIIFLGIPLVIIIKSSFVKMGEPYGVEIKREEAPMLFDMIDEIRDQLKTPKISKILIDYTYNASVSQIPRLGLLGFNKNYLVIGLPFLLCMSKDRLKSIIAHEMGHISKRHGFITTQIYILRNTWNNIVYFLEQENHVSSFVFRFFLDKFLPFFNSYSFILMRKHEYEADKLAAEVVGEKITGETFIYGSLYYRLYNDHFNNFSKIAKTERKPPQNPISSLSESFKNELSNQEIFEIINHQLKEEITYEDVHPSFKDRLDALNYKIDRDFKPVFNRSSLDLLGKDAKAICKRIDEYWLSFNKDYWNSLYKSAKVSEKQIATLESKENLTEDNMIDQGFHFLNLGDKEKAMECFEKVLKDNPDNHEVNFEYGLLLLSKEKDEGVKYLKKAAELKYQCKLEALSHIYSYYKSKNDEENADYYYDKYTEFSNIYQQSEVERSQWQNTKLLQHDLSLKEIDMYVDHLKNYEDIEKAYLVKGSVKHFPDYPCYYLAIELKCGLMNKINQDYETCQDRCNQILAEFAHLKEIVKTYDLFYFPLNYTPGGGKIKKIANSLLYQNKHAKTTKKVKR